MVVPNVLASRYASEQMRAIWSAPDKIVAERQLWLAVLASNIGTWMQTVGAQWLLVHEPNASTLVALVQTASMLPILLLALPAGALADTLDRRRLLLAVQLALFGIGALLTGLTAAGRMPPALLLTLTFAIGVGQALTLDVQHLEGEAAGERDGVGQDVARIRRHPHEHPVLAGLGEQALRQLRRRRELRDGDTRVELSLDAVDVVVRGEVVDQFAELETKTDALYFTLSTLATVGFGDVHAAGQLGRALVSVQVTFDLVFVAAVVTVLTTQLRARAAERRSGQPPP